MTPFQIALQLLMFMGVIMATKRLGELHVEDCGYEKRNRKQTDILWRICPQVEFERWGDRGQLPSERGVAYACSIGPRGGKYINILSMRGAEVIRNINSVRFLTHS